MAPLLVAAALALASPSVTRPPSPAAAAADDGSTPPSSARPCRPWQFHVAPMQCYTNSSLRRLHRLLSPDSVLWTEMEKVSDLLLIGDEHGDGGAANHSDDGHVRETSLRRRFGLPDNDGDSVGGSGAGVVLQLGGSDPAQAYRCVRQIQSMHGYAFSEINLNCGCPSVESGGSASFGASLMRRPGVTRSVLESIREAVAVSSPSSTTNTEVSLKCRIGVWDTPDTMEPFGEDEYQSLCHYITEAERAGVSHVVLHARPAVLSGLSPVKNRIVPELDYGVVERVARDFPSLRITLNGGISSLDGLARERAAVYPDCIGPSKGGADGYEDGRANHIASHMAGRWMLRRPLDLAFVQRDVLSADAAAHASETYTAAAAASIQHAVGRYVEFVVASQSLPPSRQIVPTAELYLPLYLVLEQLREDYDALTARPDGGGWKEDSPIAALYPRPLMTMEEIESLYDALLDAVSCLVPSHGGGRKRIKLPTADAAVNFKKLSAAFKGLVGTKVVNKWKRNRSEL